MKIFNFPCWHSRTFNTPHFFLIKRFLRDSNSQCLIFESIKLAQIWVPFWLNFVSIIPDAEPAHEKIGFAYNKSVCKFLSSEKSYHAFKESSRHPTATWLFDVARVTIVSESWVADIYLKFLLEESIQLIIIQKLIK